MAFPLVSQLFCEVDKLQLVYRYMYSHKIGYLFDHGCCFQTDIWVTTQLGITLIVDIKSSIWRVTIYLSLHENDMT